MRDGVDGEKLFQLTLDELKEKGLKMGDRKFLMSLLEEERERNGMPSLLSARNKTSESSEDKS